MAELISEGYYYRGSFVARVINVAVGLVEIALVLRLALQLLGANPGSPFVAWVYSVSSAFIGPFAGAFPGVQVAPGSVLDVVALLAMVVYALLGWLIIELIGFLFGTLSRT